jgi:hypothetical protein
MVIVAHVGIVGSHSFFHREFSSNVIFAAHWLMAEFLVLTRQYAMIRVTRFACSRSLWESAPEIRAMKSKAQREATSPQGPKPGSQRHRCEWVRQWC